MHNLGVLLLELFELYGTAFQYEAVGVALGDHHGGYFRKVWWWLRRACIYPVV
jgi:DNA polymerase sigma